MVQILISFPRFQCKALYKENTRIPKFLPRYNFHVIEQTLDFEMWVVDAFLSDFPSRELIL